MSVQQDVFDLIEKLETRVRSLERFQSWIFGVGAGVGAIVGLLSDNLKGLFG